MVLQVPAVLKGRDMTDRESRSGVKLSSQLGLIACTHPQAYTLPLVSDYVADSSDVLVSRLGSANDIVPHLREAGERSNMIVDAGCWKKSITGQGASAVIGDGLDALNLEQWAKQVVKSTAARAVLTPSYHVPFGEWDSLEALLRATAAEHHPSLVTLVPIGAKVLEGQYLDQFLDRLSATRPRQMAFVFTGNKKPFSPDSMPGGRARIRGLRRLLARFPGTWVLGVDPLIATDALAYGAGLVAVGPNYGERNPSGPDDRSSGGRAVKGLPGFFLSSLLELRSPGMYEEWFSNLPPDEVEFCEECDRHVDSFDSTEEDRQRIFEHNLHATAGFVNELVGRQERGRERRAWLDKRRCHALEGHTGRGTMVGPIQADQTLRALCELDDPWGRSTNTHGAWI
ncbi:MAG: hypothetical protein ACRC20_13950 [Segniliparus sp.]|uniref:hypothetical protein n=1 Tax=Segniliparus sp. TaxID=2804064 RepID=UPI003F364BFE